jgi:hypothetical protein
MSVGEKKTFLITKSPSEKVQLFIRQDTTLEELVEELRYECSLARGQVFELSLAEVQINNCFHASTLNEVLDLGRMSSFHLHLQQTLREGLTGFNQTQRLSLLEVARKAMEEQIQLIEQQRQNLGGGPQVPNDPRPTEQHE